MQNLIENATGLWPIWLKWCPTADHLAILAETRLLNSSTITKELFSVQICNRKFHIRTLRAYRTSFEYEEDRDKYFQRPPIVMVHGMGAGLAMWCKNLDDIGHYRQIYAFDLLGFGNSSRATFPNDNLKSEELFNSSIEEWREYLKLQKFILMGHSLGGFVAYSYAIQYSQFISHLILVDPWGMREYKNKRKKKLRCNWTLLIGMLGFIFRFVNPLFPIRLLGPMAPSVLKFVRQDLGLSFRPLHISPTMENLSELSRIQEDEEEAEVNDGKPRVSDGSLATCADVNAIFDYVYHCNVKWPSGESAFKSLSDPIGWASRPMVRRVTQLDMRVPVTFVYGGKSWMDWQTGYQVQHLRADSLVNVRVIDNAGHHVYAEASQAFNAYINEICLNIEDDLESFQSHFFQSGSDGGHSPDVSDDDSTRLAF